MYCALLGAYAGDVALMFGATGGVYLIGEMLRVVQTALVAGELRRHFVAKGPMRAYLERIPVYRVRTEQPGLIGAAAYLQNRHSRDGADASQRVRWAASEDE